MVKNNINHAIAVKNEYGLQLMGITAHVYLDTFSHYGFSAKEKSFTSHVTKESQSKSHRREIRRDP